MNLQRLYKTFIEDPQERAKLPRPVRKYFEEVSNGSAKQNAPQSPRLSRSGSQSPPLIGGFQPPPPPPTFGFQPPPPPPTFGFQPPPPPSGGFQPPPIPGFGGPPLTGIGMGVTAPVKHGTLSRQIYDKALMLCCATWFFKGPAVTIDDYGNFAAFIDKKDTCFRRQMCSKATKRPAWRSEIDLKVSSRLQSAMNSVLLTASQRHTGWPGRHAHSARLRNCPWAELRVGPVWSIP